MNDVFRATHLWNSMVNYMRENVHVKTCRYLLRSYERSFSGGDAVDVLYRFLKLNGAKHRVRSDVSRNNAVRVCQLLVDQKILTVAGGSGSNDVTCFQDSQTKFYRFSKVDVKESSPGDHFRDVFRREIDEDKSRFCDNSLDVFANRSVEDEDDENDENVAVVDEDFHFKRTFTRMSIRTGRNAMKKLRTFANRTKSRSRRSDEGIDKQSMFNDKEESVVSLKRTWTVASLHASRERANKKFQSLKNEDHENDPVLKDFALARLLVLTDVQFVEEIIFMIDAEINSKEDFSLNPSFLSKRRTCDDAWLLSAQSCVNGPIKGCKAIGLSIRERRAAAFDGVVANYSHYNSPLVPETLQNIFKGIFGLLMENKIDAAVQSLQFCCNLLCWQRRRKIHKLLRFMDVVARDTVTKLSTKSSNFFLVLSKLGRKVIDFPILGAKQVFFLVFLMMRYHDDIMEIPKELIRLAEDDAETVLYFSQQMSAEDAERAKASTTQHCLTQLLHIKVTDLNMSSREKSKWLRTFHKTHPEIYRKYFKMDP